MGTEMEKGAFILSFSDVKLSRVRPINFKMSKERKRKRKEGERKECTWFTQQF